MLRKLASYSLIALLGVVAFGSAIHRLSAEDSKPTVNSDEAEKETTVSVFGGGQQPLAETVQFLVTGPEHSKIATLRGDVTMKLPGRLSLASKNTTASFRLTNSGTDFDTVYRGSLTFFPSPPASDFFKSNAITVNITATDLRDASNGVVTQFIFLPHRLPTEKWAGQFGTLTMGNVTSSQRAEVLKNLASRGHLLAQIQVVAERLAGDKALPAFPADERARRTTP